MNTENKMQIGSGDIVALLSGKYTITHKRLIEQFVSGVKPRYNSLHPNCPGQFRAGAILETKYYSLLPKEYCPQYPAVSDEMDVFICHLDYALLDNGIVKDFEEVKTIKFDNFKIISRIDDNSVAVQYIKKYYKTIYNQIQEQLFCTKLSEATLTFISVHSYEDVDNYMRVLTPDDVFKIRISRDEEIISRIKERGSVFQVMRDYYKKDITPSTISYGKQRI